ARPGVSPPRTTAAGPTPSPPAAAASPPGGRASPSSPPRPRPPAGPAPRRAPGGARRRSSSPAAPGPPPRRTPGPPPRARPGPPTPRRQSRRRLHPRQQSGGVLRKRLPGLGQQFLDERERLRGPAQLQLAAGELLADVEGGVRGDLVAAAHGQRLAQQRRRVR